MPSPANQGSRAWRAASRHQSTGPSRCRLKWPMPGKDSEPAQSQQLPASKAFPHQIPHIPRTLPSAWAPEGRSLTSLSGRSPLISWWELSSAEDALSSGNSYFTKWSNYAWSLATVSNSLRYDSPLPPHEEEHPRASSPHQPILAVPSPAGSGRAAANAVHTGRGGKRCWPTERRQRRPNKILLAELSPPDPAGGSQEPPLDQKRRQMGM